MRGVDMITSLLPITVVAAVALFFVKEILEFARRRKSDERKKDAIRHLLARGCELNNWTINRISYIAQTIKDHIAEKDAKFSMVFTRAGRMHFRYETEEEGGGASVDRVHTDLLSKQLLEIAIEQRPSLIKSLSRQGVSELEMTRLPDGTLTRLLVDLYERRLSESHVEGIENAAVLKALKTLRDKNVAHPEAIALSDLPQATFGQIGKLVALARTFVGAVGMGYLSIAYEDDRGDYPMSSDCPPTRSGRRSHSGDYSKGHPFSKNDSRRLSSIS